jgi:putative DNA primase/helicase
MTWEQYRQDIVGEGFGKNNPFRANVVADAMAHCFHWMTRPGEGESGGILHFYEDGVYRPNGVGVAESLLLDFLGEYATQSRWNDVIHCLKVSTKVHDFAGTVNNGRLIPADARMTWLNVANGLYNVRTDTLIAHTPRYLSTIQIQTPVERNAPDGFIARFWKMCIPEGCDLLAKQILGYLLFPTTDKERAFLAVGPAGTGKSRFLEMVRAMLGDENVGYTDLLTLSDNKYGAHDLVDKLANLGDDLPSGVIQDSSTFKKVVSGIPMRAEQKYQAAFTFRPVARLMFTANEVPRSRDKQEAWYVRWVILPFTRVVRGTPDEIDASEFMERVEKQLPGLLNYALEGLRSLEDRGSFDETVETKAAKEDMMRENDPVYAFIADHTEWSAMPAATVGTSASVVREAFTVGKDELFLRFASWCEAEGIKFPTTRRDFNKRIKDTGKVVEAKGTDQDTSGLRGKRVWRGIKVLDIRSGEEHLDEERY